MIGSAFDPNLTMSEIRVHMEKATKMAFLPAKTKVEKVTINDIPSEWISGKNANEENVILYLHGGGYNTGSPSTHREFAAHISNGNYVIGMLSGCMPVVITYIGNSNFYVRKGTMFSIYHHLRIEAFISVINNIIDKLPHSVYQGDKNCHNLLLL